MLHNSIKYLYSLIHMYNHNPVILYSNYSLKMPAVILNPTNDIQYKFKWNSTIYNVVVNTENVCSLCQIEMKFVNMK
jgi:hypothetical protein